MMKYVKKGHIFLKSSFCCYFFVGLLSFWNISLLFNFLHIPFKPQFAYVFLELLALIFYKLNTLLEFISGVLGLPEGSLQFGSGMIEEQME